MDNSNNPFGSQNMSPNTGSQPLTGPQSGNFGAPVNPNGYQAPGSAYAGVNGLGSTASPNPQDSNKIKKSSSANLIKTIALVATSLLSVAFIGLFIWMYVQWDDVKTDVDGKINKAVAESNYELQTKLETEFAEKEKYPYRTFAGPADFGQLTFEYPKTWNVYIPDDASQAQDFHAYLNPDHVAVVSDKTVMALRVSIVNELMDKVTKKFNDKVEKGEMKLSTTVLNGANVNVYTGLLDSKYYGIACIFKIRDKTAILQTDAEVFKDDYYKVLETVKFNV